MTQHAAPSVAAEATTLDSGAISRTAPLCRRQLARHQLPRGIGQIDLPACAAPLQAGHVKRRLLG